jgi:glycosyltransferase involved in cell wall biosynthesis
MGHTIVLSSGRKRPSEALVIAPLHPFPPRCGSAVRIGQYIRWMVERGWGVDLVVLSDAVSRDRDEESARAALEFCGKVAVARHPAMTSPLARLAIRFWGRLHGFRLGDHLHCPSRLERLVRRHFGSRRFRTVIVSGVHLARLAGLFRPPTRRILEAQDVWYDRYKSYAALGRGTELVNFADPRREARLVNRFDSVIAISSRDAAIFRQIGVRRPISVVPFAADPELLGIEGGPILTGDAAIHEREPVRPPRILFVGTETSNNLDGIRFFRGRVFPAVRRQVPSCRLRVVGLAAHHLDPGPGVDLVGWVERLCDEYRDAALVVVPLRMGSGLKTKTVEALAHGKALLTTSVGAQGIDLDPGRHAVVSDDPRFLSREAVRILTDDAVRRAYQSEARALARRLFDPESAFGPLAGVLGLDGHRTPRSPEPGRPVMPRATGSPVG